MRLGALAALALGGITGLGALSALGALALAASCWFSGALFPLASLAPRVRALPTFGLTGLCGNYPEKWRLRNARPVGNGTERETG